MLWSMQEIHPSKTRPGDIVLPQGNEFKVTVAAVELCTWVYIMILPADICCRTRASVAKYDTA